MGHLFDEILGRGMATEETQVSVIVLETGVECDQPGCVRRSHGTDRERARSGKRDATGPTVTRCIVRRSCHQITRDGLMVVVVVVVVVEKSDTQTTSAKLVRLSPGSVQFAARRGLWS